MRLPILLLLCASLNAADFTVCASMCSSTTLPGALALAGCGDTISIAAGYDAGPAMVQTQACAANNKLTIRSSAYASLPADGYRVNPVTNAAALAPITGTDVTFGTLYIGRPEMVVDLNGVNTTTDVITFNSTSPGSYPANGLAVTFGDSPAALPAPLQLETIYYLRDVSGMTAKVAATLGGAAIDLTTTGTAGNASYYARPRYSPAVQPSGIKLLGLDIKFSTGSPTSLLTVGDPGITSALAASANLEVSHCIIEGYDVNTWSTGPTLGIDVNSVSSWIHDSYVYHLHASTGAAAGTETKALLVRNLGTNNLIEGNYLSAASINLLTAGQVSSVYQHNITDLTIRRNYLAKEGYMMYNEAASTPPAGAGKGWYFNGSGAYYRNTSVATANCSGGGCYRAAVDGTWTQDTSLPFRNHSIVTKNLLELKDCVRCLIENNVLAGNPESAVDAGQGFCFGYSILGPAGEEAASVYHRGENITLQNNWCQFTWGALWGTGTGDTVAPLSNNTWYNNLVTDMRAPILAVTPSVGDVSDGIRLLTAQTNLLVNHNTVRLGNITSKNRSSYLVVPATLGGVSTMTPGFLMNNILPYGNFGMFIDTSDATCGVNGIQKFTANPSSPKYLANSVSYNQPAGTENFGSCATAQNWVTNADAAMGWNPDSSLSATSPYSARNPSAAFVATDGSDVGANVAQVVARTFGVIAGVPNTSTNSTSITGQVTISGRATIQ